MRKLAFSAMLAAGAVGILTGGLSVVAGATAVLAFSRSSQMSMPPAQGGRHIYKSGAYYLHGGEEVINSRMGRDGGGPGDTYGQRSGGTQVTNNYIYVNDVFSAERQQRENKRAQIAREYQ